MRNHMLTVATAALLAAGTAYAQGAQTTTTTPRGVRLKLDPTSELSFDGTSTLHSFSCKTNAIEAYIDVDSMYRTKPLNTLEHPIVNVRVLIPVKTLACGGKLEGNMRKTLRADQFPTISYTLSTYDIIKGTAAADSFATQTKGALSIAGKENPAEMRVDASRLKDGVVSAKGQYALKMTDYGIKPPSFMLGTLRVGNQVTVRFTLKATSQAVAAAVAERLEQLAASR